MKKMPARRSYIADIFERPFSFLREFERSFSEALENLDVENVVWTPNIDLVEREDKYEVYVEIPGVSRDDIKINVKDNTLVIHGERKRNYEQKEGDIVHYASMWYGKFHAEITLPSDADTDNIKAVYKNGILRIEIPKHEKARAKEIEIKVEE